jgi:DNA invertase Pin-like site-specific DNA recombinase
MRPVDSSRSLVVVRAANVRLRGHFGEGRLGRDTRELLAIVEDDLHVKGRHFRTVHGIVFDTSDDMCGELIFTVFAAIAKCQRQRQRSR